MFVVDERLPPSFDPVFYRKDKPFLRSSSEAQEHFLNIGKSRGIKGSPGCDQGVLLAAIRSLRPEKMIEIGPGCAPKLRGENVRYFDVKSKAELQSRYKDDPGLFQIPQEIHYVNKAGSLKDIAEKFDIAFSSHVIEHAADLVCHLNEVEALLDKNGLYVLVVPNKQFTFDYFKPVSIVEDVVARHFEPIKTVPLRSILLEANRRTHNEPERHWENDHGSVCFNKHEMLKAIAMFGKTVQDSVAASGYHNWIFTDDSFVEIVQSLYEMNLISLKVKRAYNTPYGTMSFSVVLGR